MSNRPHGLRPVWMLAAMVLMAKASKLGCESLGQEACSSEDEDDFSLIQADRSKAPGIRQLHDRNRAALAQGSIASVDKQSSNEASENSTVGAGVPEEAETVVVPEAAVEAETVAATEEAAAAGVAAASDAGAALPSKTTVSLSHQSTQQTAAEHKAKVVAQLRMNGVPIVIGIILIGAAAICVCMALTGPDKRPNGEVGQGDARSQQHAARTSPGTGQVKPGQAMDLPPGAAAQHLQQRQNSAQAIQSGTSMPGNLVLPAVESRFNVSLEELSRAGRDCTMQVLAPSGLPLLSLVISNASRLDIGYEGGILRSVVAPAEVGGAFIIHDNYNKPYGEFRNTGPGRAEVITQGRTVMVVEGSTQSLQFSVQDMSGKPMALARVNNKDFKSDYLEVRSLPGADAVLVLSVILAIAIFTSSQPAGSGVNSGSPLARGT